MRTTVNGIKFAPDEISTDAANEWRGRWLIGPTFWLG